MKPGQRIGAFDVIDRLGAGGMGEVYRARDTVLGRDVAVKILPADFGSDPGRIERLAREARLLASLNHPNIAAIYAVESAGPIRALILELVEGETLGARLRRKPLPPADARAIARQIAEAFDAAHECGIVHRDLKPENVMITPRGGVKVLDFGVAKSTPAAGADEAPTVTGVATMPGAVIGTAAYMSPEQARGLPVDRRTDIWAFGCVLYEMLTGRAAFRGATLSDTIAATLEKEPDWSALPRDTPPGMRRLLRRCLEKDPRNRLRDIADGLPDLDDDSPPAAARSRQRLAWMPWAVAAAAIVGALWLATQIDRSPPADPLASSTLTPLTRDAGHNTTPAISRDGRLLAYASDRGGGGGLDLWVQQIAGSPPVRLTDHEADDSAPDFSPDGSQIAFRSERANGGIYVAPALGSKAAPRLLVAAGRDPKFSPDGRRLAYWTGAVRGAPSNVRASLFVLPLAGGEAVPVAREFRIARAPVWAPDGRSLIFLGRRDNSPLAQSFDWWWVRLDGSAPVKTELFADVALRNVERPPSVWTAEGVFFSDGRDIRLARVSPDDGRLAAPPTRLTLSAGAYGAPSVSGDGRIVFASTLTRRVIERSPLRGETTVSEEVYADFSPLPGRPSQTRDGSTIVFERPAGDEAVEIWTRNLRTGVEQSVTRASTTTLVSATISPDGARIAYRSGEGGAAACFVVETDGGVPRRICDKCQVYGFLSDSRRVLIVSDGELRAYDTLTAAATVLFRQSEGRGIDRPHVSPDDRWLAFRSAAQGQKSFVVRLTPGGVARGEDAMQIDEPTISSRPAGWSADASLVYLLLDSDGFRCLWAQRIGADGRLAGRPEAVRHFHGAEASDLSTSFGDAISPLGFLYSGMKSSGNIWSLQRQP
jgi:Tol biopolymer transport system component